MLSMFDPQYASECCRFLDYNCKFALTVFVIRPKIDFVLIVIVIINHQLIFSAGMLPV